MLKIFINLNSESRVSLLPSAITILALLSFAIRSVFFIPILTGTWIRSVFVMEPYGFMVTGIGPYYDGSLGWPLLVALMLVLMASFWLIYQGRRTTAAYAVIVLVLVASIPIWVFPLALLVPVALLFLPFFAAAVTLQLFSKEPKSASTKSRLRAAYLFSLFILTLAVFDWTMVFLVGGS
jgi:hypothetical protein